MATEIQNSSVKERGRTYKDVLKSLRPLMRKYDEKVIVWALNKYISQQREINRAFKEKTEAEKKLKELGAI